MSRLPITPLPITLVNTRAETPGLKRMTGLQSPEEGLFQATTQTAGKVYVTLGSEGSLWIEDGHLCQQEAKMVICVNRRHFLSMWLIPLEQAMFFTAHSR